ncbi:RNA polymerase factor sigma-54 [Bacillus infantis]|uniref:RNA polymerase factor sigma-54 n=1 Tax=Bacillus infantis TaxID=324767 RepID=UPI0021558161|nr:RNA polymerase factor sigma-54 [Bacillus infantis]MCR6612679.1 RNA polymerase factor sigma-54 [Bacillus infantis]
MNMNAGLFQQQSLKLAMTQELSQAIALLQYSALELTAFLESRALENPLMQVETETVRAMDPRRDRVRGANSKLKKDDRSWIEQIRAKDNLLEDYLISQLEIKYISPLMDKIIRRIIASIDENGYFCDSITDIADELCVSEDDAAEALAELQLLEPAGIGARTLQECLLLQVQRLLRPDELAEVIIEEHFEWFADKKWKPLAALLGVELKDIQRVSDLVRSLNPRPAAAFSKESAGYIVPDVAVSWDGSSFLITVQDEQLPKVSFNSQYYESFKSTGDKEVRKYLQDRSQDYNWIVRSLEQRKETIKKVTMKLVEKQQDFFIAGPSKLKPMTMKEIADELEIHESTVSRTVREKYVQTPFGTFELKTFFTSTVKTTGTDGASSAGVKQKISALVDGEDKLKPLSDSEIMAILEKKADIVISRRTVAKYRDQLGIPSSAKRKRYE